METDPSTVPSWVPFLAVIAALGGVLITGLLNLWRDHLSARREDQRTLKGDKRSAYLRALQVCSRLGVAFAWLASGADFTKGEKRMKALTDEASDTFAEIALYASSEAEKAAWEVVEAVDNITRHVTEYLAADQMPQNPPLQTRQGKQLLQAFNEARDRFRYVAQKDAGLPVRPTRAESSPT